MTPNEFIVWLKNYIFNSNFDSSFTQEIIEKLNQIQDLKTGVQLEIPFPDYPNKVQLNFDYVTNTTI